MPLPFLSSRTNYSDKRLELAKCKFLSMMPHESWMRLNILAALLPLYGHSNQMWYRVLHGPLVNVTRAPAQDGNAGLLKQALAARQMRHTQRLTQTYLTLSLADIARHVGLASPQEAEQHILRQTSCLHAMLDVTRIICCALAWKACTHRWSAAHCHGHTCVFTLSPVDQ